MATKKLEIQVIQDEESPNQFELNAEIIAGSLTSNAKELKERIEKELENYSVEKYEQNPELAKSDKALLNKLKDSVANKRKEINNAWNKPLEEFLLEMKSLENSIQNASDKINEIVKESDLKEKQVKREQIENFWKTLDFALVPLEKIFNPKWLNKTTKFESIISEIESITERITTELATLRSMNDEDSEILQSFYLETLDLNSTLAKGNELKANRESIRKQNEEWKNQKLQEQAEKTVKALENANLIPQTSTLIQNPEKKIISNSNEMTFTLKLYGTKEKLIALRKYIDANGIKYEKL